MRTTPYTARVRGVARPGVHTLTSLFESELALSGSGETQADGSPATPGTALVPSSMTLDEFAEVVDGELVDSTPSDLGDLTIDGLLDAFLHDGRLVPARSAEAEARAEPGISSRALARANELDQIRAGAWADATLLSYGGAVTAYREWCREENVPALPFDPRVVVNHLLDYTFEWDEAADDFRRTDDHRLVARVTAGSVELRLAGLNKAAEFIGLPRPGDNFGVQQVMRGIRRRLGVAHINRKAALDLNLLTACLHAATGATFSTARSKAMVLMRARARVACRVQWRL